MDHDNHPSAIHPSTNTGFTASRRFVDDLVLMALSWLAGLSVGLVPEVRGFIIHAASTGPRIGPEAWIILIQFSILIPWAILYRRRATPR